MDGVIVGWFDDDFKNNSLYTYILNLYMYYDNVRVFVFIKSIKHIFIKNL